MMRYCAPVSLPTFAAVPFATRPDAARSCSLRTCSSFERSTTLNFSVDVSSLVSMLLRSRPAPLYHQAAEESLVNSATPTEGLLAARAADAVRRIQTLKKTAVKRFIFVDLLRFGSAYCMA